MFADGTTASPALWNPTHPTNYMPRAKLTLNGLEHTLDTVWQADIYFCETKRAGQFTT